MPPLAVVHSRRLLLHTILYRQPPPPPPLPPSVSPPADNPEIPGSSFDSNVIMIVAILLCGLIFALGLNSLVRCTFRLTARSEHDIPPTRPGRRALRFVPTLPYSAGLKLTGSGSEGCSICLSDFADGDWVRVLPKCSHGFHARCVDRWLIARTSCPICRQCLFGSVEKPSGCSGRPGPSQAVIVPLEPERFVGVS